jgi:hypothetical protein
MPIRLEQAFSDGLIVRPSDERANLVHLVRAIGTLCGVPNLVRGAATRELIELIRPAEHLVFVLLDGLGMNIIERLPASSFLVSNLKREIAATSPSTTACALTTVATADYPNHHGVTGWFTHLPEHDVTAMTLPFAERFTGKPLAERGIRPEHVLPLPAIAPRMTRNVLTLSPSYIASTVYNIYARGGTPGRGYQSNADAIDQLIARLSDAAEPTYTHLYFHDIDTLCHHVGVNHDSVVPLVLGIDAELRRLADTVKGKARIVVSADHGLLDVPKPDQALLQVGDSLLELLKHPPSGDARMPIFHVREGSREPFVEAFNERFGDRFALTDVNEAERLELFGPGPIAPAIRNRFGDYIGVACRPATVAYHPPHKPLGDLYLAVHAGLSPEEMRVPVCVA